jgi:predicted XRE-type DNA-binding protein
MTKRGGRHHKAFSRSFQREKVAEGRMRGCSAPTNRKTKMPKLPAHDVSSGNIFADLGLPNSVDLLLKAEIVSEISRLVKLKKLTQAKAATLTGVAQPDLSNLMRRKFRGFSIEMLLLMLSAFGRDADVVVRPAGIANKTGGIRFRRDAA